MYGCPKTDIQEKYPQMSKASGPEGNEIVSETINVEPLQFRFDGTISKSPYLSHFLSQ